MDVTSVKLFPHAAGSADQYLRIGRCDLQNLFDQLADEGRMVIPVGPQHSQELQLVHKRAGQPVINVIEGCRFVPLIGAEGATGDVRVLDEEGRAALRDAVREGRLERSGPGSYEPPADETTRAEYPWADDGRAVGANGSDGQAEDRQQGAGEQPDPHRLRH